MSLGSVFRSLTQGDRVRHAARIRALPDRQLMSTAYVPDLAARGGWILWVGCRDYTLADYPALEASGGIVWTMDIDPRAERWGRSGRHRTGDVCEVDAVFASLRFDAVICNGVLGFGVDAPDQQRRALTALERVLAPGGCLLLGWNTDRIDDPVAAGLTPQGLERAPLGGQQSRVEFSDVSHVYDCFVRTGDAPSAPFRKAP